jgi:hypothetical protein
MGGAYGYDPAEFGRLKVGIMQNMSDRISRDLQNVGDSGAKIAQSAANINKSKEKEANEVAVAEHSRKQVANLIRAAREAGYTGNNGEAAEQDPIAALPTARQIRSNPEYWSKQLSDTATALAWGLVQSENVPNEQIDRLLGMPGWSDKARQVMSKKSQSVRAGQDLREITQPQHVPSSDDQMVTLGPNMQRQPVEGPPAREVRRDAAGSAYMGDRGAPKDPQGRDLGYHSQIPAPKVKLFGTEGGIEEPIAQTPTETYATMLGRGRDESTAKNAASMVQAQNRIDERQQRTQLVEQGKNMRARAREAISRMQAAIRYDEVNRKLVDQTLALSREMNDRVEQMEKLRDGKGGLKDDLRRLKNAADVGIIDKSDFEDAREEWDNFNEELKALKEVAAKLSNDAKVGNKDLKEKRNIRGSEDETPETPGGPDNQMSAEDRQAYQWAQANPNDPRSQKILQTLRSRGLIQ